MLHVRQWVWITVLLLVASPALAADARGMAWRVSDDAGNTAYLVGTVHAASPDFYPLPQAIEDAFDDSEVLVVEVDVGGLDPAEIGRITNRYGTYDPPASLRETLPDGSWKLVGEWAQRFRIPRQRFERMRPWLAAITFVALEMQRIGLDPQLGMERHFVQRAAGSGHRIDELESFEEQIAMLAGLSEDTQVRFFEKSLDDVDEIDATVKRIMSVWRDGDLDAMTAFMSETYEDETELYDTMLRERNARWLPRIEEMIASGHRHFFAVGSMHLAGDDGLVALLEKRGYRLERI